jgi:hypothetical protein
MQINLPTTMLRALKGAPLSIIAGLQMEPYATVAALASRTGYSANSVRSGLRTLTEMQLCHSSNGRTWCLTARAHNLILPWADALPAPKSPPAHDNTSALAARTNIHDTSEAQEMQVRPQNMQVQGPDMRLDGDIVQAPPVAGTAGPATPPQNLRKDPVVVVDPSEDPDQATTTSPLLQTLREAGVWPATAEALGDDPWLTQERLDGWLDNLEGQNRRRPGAIRSIPAVLVANLRAHREPPPARDRGNSPGPERWAAGSGLCPACWTRPCRCDEG